MIPDTVTRERLELRETQASSSLNRRDGNAISWSRTTPNRRYTLGQSVGHYQVNGCIFNQRNQWSSPSHQYETLLLLISSLWASLLHCRLHLKFMAISFLLNREASEQSVYNHRMDSDCMYSNPTSPPLSLVALGSLLSVPQFIQL